MVPGRLKWTELLQPELFQCAKILSRVVVGDVLWCQSVQHEELEHVGAQGIPVRLECAIGVSVEPQLRAMPVQERSKITACQDEGPAIRRVPNGADAHGPWRLLVLPDQGLAIGSHGSMNQPGGSKRVSPGQELAVIQKGGDLDERGQTLPALEGGDGGAKLGHGSCSSLSAIVPVQSPHFAVDRLQ